MKVLLVFLLSLQLNSADLKDNISYLDNGVVRVGVDLDLGGSITYLADAVRKDNIVNSFDWGRQIQMSFYSFPAPYKPNGKQPAKVWEGLGWNPIQSGDHFGNRSKVLEHRNDGKTLYVKCIPMHWPLDNEPAQCRFESWITLADDTVEVRNRISNQRSDHTFYAARTQECPAIYTNGTYYRLMTYRGTAPFTGAPLDRITKLWLPDTKLTGSPWDTWQATENWAALVNDDDFGVGIFTPGTYLYSGGFAGYPGNGGEKDSPTGYISPNQQEILDHNIQYEYRYTLIVGRLERIRKYVYDHSDYNRLPDYHFKTDRQHWHYIDAIDSGWPIKGELNIVFEKEKPRLIGPPGFWKAEDVPKLIIRAAHHTQNTQARIFWKNFGDRTFSQEKSVTVTIISDGTYHNYDVPLASSNHYRDIITALRFDPVTSGSKGESVQIQFISYKK